MCTTRASVAVDTAMWSPPSDLPAPTDLLGDTETKKAKLPPGSPVARAEAALAEEKVNSKAGPGCDRKRKAQCRPARRGAGSSGVKGPGCRRETERGSGPISSFFEA